MNIAGKNPCIHNIFKDMMSPMKDDPSSRKKNKNNIYQKLHRNSVILRVT